LPSECSLLFFAPQQSLIQMSVPDAAGLHLGGRKRRHFAGLARGISILVSIFPQQIDRLRSDRYQV
jgi:hypothetical protein